MNDEVVGIGGDNVTHRLCDVTDRCLVGCIHCDLARNSSPFGVDQARALET
jgi:hypothetical protein